MLDLGDSSTKQTKQRLNSYSPLSSIDLIAGLCVIPEMSVYHLRLSVLIHLLLSCGKGKKRLFRATIETLINSSIHDITSQTEDPYETVNVSNIITEYGNYSVITGMYDGSEYILQNSIEALGTPEVPSECRQVLRHGIALLKLGNEVVRRNQLVRWCGMQSLPEHTVTLPSIDTMKRSAASVSFTKDEITACGITEFELQQFVLPRESFQRLAEDKLGISMLERFPIVQRGDKFIYALPHATCTTIMRYYQDELCSTGFLEGFHRAVRMIQIENIQKGIMHFVADGKQLLNSDYNESNGLASWEIEHDRFSYLHIVCVCADTQDDYNNIEPVQLSEEKQNVLNRYIDHKIEEYVFRKSTKCGLTLVIGYGINPNIYFYLNRRYNIWKVIDITQHDMCLMMRYSRTEIEQYIVFARQIDWYRQQGIEIPMLFGYYYLFCFWRLNNYLIMPIDAPMNNGIIITAPFELKSMYRQKLMQSLDTHAIQAVDGEYIEVVRYGHSSDFESMRELPLYVSITRPEPGQLKGVLETNSGVLWLNAIAKESVSFNMKVTYELWRGVFELLPIIMKNLRIFEGSTDKSPIEILLNCKRLENFLTHTNTHKVLDPVFRQVATRTVEICFPDNYIDLFRGHSDHGERITIKYVIRAIYTALAIDLTENIEEVINSLVDIALPSAESKFIHIFETFDPTDVLMFSKNNTIRFLPDELFHYCKMQIMSDNRDNIGRVYIGKAECTAYLNQVVDSAWIHIKSIVSKFNRMQLVCKALDYLERVYSDRTQWKVSAAAQFALYQDREEVQRTHSIREGKRTAVSVASRILMEIAICEAPTCEGVEIARWELEELLTKVNIMILNANHSDAVHNDYVGPKLTVLLSGDHTIKNEFYNDVLIPFTQRIRYEEYQTAASEYRELYNKTNMDHDEEWIPSRDFSEAFLAEYGITPEGALICVIELIDFAYERDTNVVIETGDVLKRLIVENRNLPENTVESFFIAYTLYSRDRWDKVPTGYEKRDIYPWRYNRRLSIVCKPILCIDINNNIIIYGVNTLKNCVMNHLHRIEDGRVPQEIISNEKLKAYIGYANERKGYEFELETARKLERKGWKTRVRVKLTEIGGDEKQGDIDVLAWDRSQKRVLIIECKRIQLARSVSEIADVCNRFRGESGDLLSKHVKRVNWIRSNSCHLEGIVDFRPEESMIEDYIVTSVPVPMKYIADLGIDCAKIVQHDYW